MQQNVQQQAAPTGQAGAPAGGWPIPTQANPPYEQTVQVNRPPEQSHALPGQAYIPPGQPYAPPGQPYAPPGQAYAPPSQTYAPPSQPYAQQGQQNTQQYQQNVFAGQNENPPDQETPQAWQTYSPYKPYTPYESEYTYEQLEAKHGPAIKKINGLWWKIAVSVIAVAIAAAAIYYFVFLRNPANMVVMALANMSSEVSQRIDGTPLKAYGLLMETIDDGTLTVNFDYEDGWFGDEVRGSVSLSSIMKNYEFAITGDIRMYDAYWDDDQRIDFRAYINKERFAAGSRLIDTNLYGFRYSTFGDDIRVFGNMVGLDRETMDQMADIVGMIEEALNTDPTERYNNIMQNSILTDFYDRCELTSEQVEISSGNGNARVTKIDIVISKEAVIGLFNDLYDLMDSDEDIRSLYETFADYTYGMSYGSMMRELRDMINVIDDAYADSNTITLSFFVGSRNRLVRMEINTNIRIEGERIRFSGTFDFGTSAKDSWDFRLTAEDATLRIVWNHTERSDRIESIIVLTADNESFTLKSDWTPSNGRFTLSANDDYGFGGEISGVFRESSGGFNLAFDDIMIDSYYEDKLSIEIVGEYGAKIDPVTYINIDDWTMDLLEKLEALFY